MRLLCKASIDAGHHIEDTEELLTKKCAKNHGHRYEITIGLDMEMLKRFYKVGFVDFELVRRDVIEKIIGLYDHTDLTMDHEINTVEELALEIKGRIMTRYRADIKQVGVTAYETSKWGVLV